MRDENLVFEKWERDCHNLNNCDDTSDFDEIVYERAKVQKLLIEKNIEDPLYTPNPVLNSNITLEDITVIVQKAKTGSAVGFDQIPYDVMNQSSEGTEFVRCCII